MRALRIACIAALIAASSPARQNDVVQRFDPGQDIGIDQRLGEKIPLGLEFRAEDGHTVALRELFDERPVVLSLVYYKCPMLCTLVLNDQVRALRALRLRLGDDFTVVTVSIDPRETPELASEKQASYVGSYDSRATPDQRAAWHFLTGDEASIAALARSVGFRYVYDSANDQYAHAAGIMVLTPDGTLSRYIYGLGYEPRDLQLALVEASDGKVGSLADQILLRCFHYDPATGKYYFAIMGTLRSAGVLTVVILLAFVLRNVLRERRARGAHA